MYICQVRTNRLQSPREVCETDLFDVIEQIEAEGDIARLWLRRTENIAYHREISHSATPYF